MPALYKICSEIQKAEINKLQGFIDVYQAGCDLIHILESMENAEEYKQNITGIKNFLMPYKAIYSWVGENAKTYVSVEMGMNFEEKEEEEEKKWIEQWSARLLKYIANPSFLAIRKELVVACRQHSKFNTLFMDTMKQLESVHQVDFFTDNHNKFKSFTDNHIKCVQIFSQFDLLSRDLITRCTTANAEGSISQVALLMQELCGAAATYSNAFHTIEGEEKKTSSAYVAAKMIYETDQRLAIVIQELDRLFHEFKQENSQQFARFSFLSQAIVIIKKMNSTLIPQTLNELTQEWKKLFPDSQTEGTSYPTTIAEICIFQQEIVTVETEHSQLATKAKLSDLIKRKDALEEVIIKLDNRIAEALLRLNATHHNCVEFTGYLPVQSAIIKTDYQSEVTLEEIPKTEKPKSSSFVKRLRALTQGTDSPKLTRTNSTSSGSSSPVSPRNQSCSSLNSSSESTTSPNDSPVSSNKLPKQLFFKALSNTEPAPESSSSPSSSADPSQDTFEQKKAKIAALYRMTTFK